MGRNKIDRTGERGINNFGSEMVIINYRKAIDIDIYFPEYNYVIKNKTYSDFKNGEIKCPYDRRVFGVGCVGEGKYKVLENGKATRVYSTWHCMLRRCYDKEFHKKNPTYKDCTVYKEWHNFQNFGKWYDNNYYEIEGEKMCLDKDILVKHNKVYSPETCIFVPERINTLFIKCDKSRGDSVIGTSPKDGKYQVSCNLINPVTGESKKEYLGFYDTQEKGFETYKYYKEKNIKEVAEYFKRYIPIELYQVLYSYEVEIDD
ncbi:MAG: AP2 domain-containing protein [Clostridia bacterium]|jgi:hypothetical protein